MTQVENPNIPQAGPFASIYVGDLPIDVTEMALYDVFMPHGQVLSVKICRDQYSSSSCYAYVNYRTKVEAERAIKGANYALFDGKQCRVMWAVKDASKRKQGLGNLFVKNIHTDLDSKALYEAFSAFGPVMTCKIAQDDYGYSKGFGFVQFYNETDAEEALKKVNGVEFRGKKLFVSKFMPKSSRVTSNRVDPNKFTNVFVKNFKDEWSVEDLKTHFSAFGEITSSIVKTDADGKSLGYGFVNFSDPDNAVVCIEKMNGYVLPSGAKLYASKAMKKTERMGYLRKAREEHKRELHQQYREQNLYIKNFDENFTYERLVEEFSKFGTIKSAQIMKDDQNRSKCFGFVCFTTPEEASNAIKEMNSKVVDGRPLYVSIAQTREERKKAFDSRFGYSAQFRAGMGVPSGMPYFYPPAPMMGFPQHFHTMRPPHPGGPRSGQRPMMQGPMPMNPAMMPNQRFPYAYQQGGGYPPHYRTRGPQMNQSMPRFDRQYQQPPGSARPNAPNSQRQHSPVRPSMNSAPKDSQGNARQEEKASTASTRVNDGPKVDVGERFFKLCQDVFTANGYDMSKVQKVCGVVLDHVKKNKKEEASNEEIKKIIMECYKSLAGAP